MLRGNDCFGACGFDLLGQNIGIESLISDDSHRRALSEQCDSFGAVCHLPGSDRECQRQAQFAGQLVDLGRQTTLGMHRSVVCALFAARGRLLIGAHQG